jgi:uncharacterized protein (DUF1501 family)
MARVDRRSFLRNLLVASAPTATSDHTLVCVFLRGGADTLNMLVPFGDDEYYKVRPTIAINAPKKSRENSVIALDDFYGLHPKLQLLHRIYGEGRLAFVQGVGSDNLSGSHFDAMDQIEHGEAFGKTIGGGWLGRYLQSKRNSHPSAFSAVAIGTSVPESLRGAPSAAAMTSADESRLQVPPEELESVARVLGTMYGAEAGMLGTAGQDALQLNKRLEKLRDKSSAAGSKAGPYPESDFGKGMSELARLIKAEVGLEIATIDHIGWDTHFYQGAGEGIQANNMLDLAKGLAGFDEDLKAFKNKVTTIVVTEFGRRSYENGSQGTDHGRGYALVAMGAGVNGGKVHGMWPGINHDGTDHPGPAGLAIGYDYRSVLGEVLKNCLHADHVDKVFPQFKLATVGLTAAKQCPQIS